MNYIATLALIAALQKQLIFLEGELAAQQTVLYCDSYSAGQCIAWGHTETNVNTTSTGGLSIDPNDNYGIR